MHVKIFFETLPPFYKEDSLLWDPLLGLKDFFSKCALGKIEVEIPENVTLVNKEQISIGKGTVIEPGAFIKGPCIIGPDCEIRHGAYIRGFVWIGKGCVVGHATEIKNSIMFDGAKAAHFAYVGDSILGKNSNLGAGVKCANYRLDQKPVLILLKGKKVNTGLQKFGCILGDNVQVGCNTVLGPGTLIGKNSYVYPCISVNGVYPKKSRIKK